MDDRNALIPFLRARNSRPGTFTWTNSGQALPSPAYIRVVRSGSLGSSGLQELRAFGDRKVRRKVVANRADFAGDSNQGQ